MMTTFSREYTSPKAPGALFAIILTLCVNVALFAALGWVNRREIVNDSSVATIIERRAFAVPKILDRRPKLKKNVCKPKAVPQLRTTLRTLRKATSRRPNSLPPTPTLPSVTITLPNIAIDLQNNLGLTIAEGSMNADFATLSGDATVLASNNGVEQPAKPIFQPQPAYPLGARRLGHVGSVHIELVINESGMPEKPRIIISSGYAALDGSALRTISRWRFSPAMDNGRKVAVRGDVTITFKLEQ